MSKIVRIIRVVDTRQYEEQGDRFVPIPGSGQVRDCDRCARAHEVHAEVELEDGARIVVGTGCAYRDQVELEKPMVRAERAAKRDARLAYELAATETRLIAYETALAEVKSLPAPNVIGSTHPKFGWPTLTMGGAWIRMWTGTESGNARVRLERELEGIWRSFEIAKRYTGRDGHQLREAIRVLRRKLGVE